MISYYKTNKIKNEIDGIKKWEENINGKDLKHEKIKYTYEFQQFEVIRSFGDNIYAINTIMGETERDRNKLLEHMVEFNNKCRPKTKEGKDKKEILLIV